MDSYKFERRLRSAERLTKITNALEQLCLLNKQSSIITALDLLKKQIQDFERVCECDARLEKEGKDV